MAVQRMVATRVRPEDTSDDLPFPQPVATMVPPWLRTGIYVRCVREWSPHLYFTIPVGAVVGITEVNFHQDTMNEGGLIAISSPEGAGLPSTNVDIGVFPQHFQPVEGEGGEAMPRRRTARVWEQEYAVGDRVIGMGVDPGFPELPEDVRRASDLPAWFNVGNTVICHRETPIGDIAIIPVGTRAGVMVRVEEFEERGMVGLDIRGVPVAIPLDIVLSHWGNPSDYPALLHPEAPPPPTTTAYHHLDDE